jgi:amino acid adenylation domain-containing protein/non-ribosomal peptide synthase protein (TIGR01720 family)
MNNTDLENLSPEEKRTLLAQLLREQAGSTTSSYPLSHGQQALWFLHQSAPESEAYNVALTLRIRSHINISALRQVFQSLGNRHPSLRTTFSAKDNGEPVQEIHGYQEIYFEQTNASTWTWEELNKQVIETYQCPFDLERGPLFRVNLFTRSEQDHILLLLMHHIVIDFWSLLVLMDELRVLYPAEKAGTKISLPPLKLSYVDSVRIQTEILAGPSGEKLWAYWRQQLSGELPVLNLPTDRPRPPVQTYHGTSYLFKLTEALTRQLKALAQVEGVTLYMLLLAAFQVLFHRYTGQEDILIGSPTSGRTRAELAGIVGYFVNLVALRANFSDNPTFTTFLKQVRRTVLEALEHQDYPFPLLVEKLQPNRDPSRSPLFQVVFALQKPQQFKEVVELLLAGETETRVNWGGLELEPFEMAQQEGQFDVTLEMVEVRESLFGVFKYNPDLFDTATVTRMVEHLKTLLQEIVTAPEQRISELSILPETERHQILVEWNDTTSDYPMDKCVHELFEAQAEQTPDAVAVVFENEPMTYHELNCRANQLAHYLQAQGVGPDVLVGICTERSLEMIVGILGTLKACGAYMPLDPTYPPERQVFMVKDAQVPVLLTQKKLAAGFPDLGVKIVCLDSDWEIISQENEENLAGRVTVENLAYTIYTSGSTGKPKGVLIPHKGLLNLIHWHQRVFEVTSSDRATQLAGTAFDASVWEVWPYLTIGACLYLVDSEPLSSPQLLRDWLISKEITISFLPTPLAEEVLSVEWPENVAMRIMLTGGDKLHKYPSIQIPFKLINNYGPTENSVVSTSGLITSDERDSISAPHIGRPIDNTQVYILDQYLQPVPIGVPGELHVGGAGLARGYLNRPELTEEKFIPNPFVKLRTGSFSDKSERIYKTGDLARYLPDGNIEFLGRTDFQVKIRGFRIELGEVEAILAGHPDVKETVVIAREDTPLPPKSEIRNPKSEIRPPSRGDYTKRLVAYLVLLDPAKAVTTNELRSFLKETLPDYMIPSAFVTLEAFPLTPNGKIDRRALPPAPEMSRNGLEQGYVVPRTSTEEILAEIWAEVLRLKQVGIHDNFFELGGDSILSIQIISRANQAGLQLTPTQLFQHQTIAELAAVTGTTTAVKAEQGLVTGPVPLTPIQHWFFEQNFSEPHYWNQAIMLETQRILDAALLQQAIKHLLEHHDALRLRFHRENGQWRQECIEQEEKTVLLWSKLSELSESEQNVISTSIPTLAAGAQTSLNLFEGPLMRVVYFDFGNEQPGRLLLIIHHLAVDGVSWRILLEDLQTAYYQLSQGESLQLPPKTTSFKTWSIRLAEYSQAEILIEESEYWLNMPTGWEIASIPPLLKRKKRLKKLKKNTEASAVQISTSLSDEQTRALLQEVPQAYNTQINDILLTALVQAFNQWTGKHALLIDLEGHGREELFEDVDVSRTVGWFTSLFPVLLELENISHPGEALKSIKEQLRRIPGRGIGYGLLCYLHQDKKTRSKLQALPKAEVSFNYLGQLDQILTDSPLFKMAKESIGPLHSPTGHRSHLLEINGFIAEGRLQLNWTYSKNIHQRKTIESLAQGFMEALQTLITHCQSPEAGGYTPSDFPDVELSQEKLDQVLDEIELDDMED